MRSLYFKIFSAPFLITFLSPGIATTINIHVPYLLSWMMMSGLLGIRGGAGKSLARPIPDVVGRNR